MGNSKIGQFFAEVERSTKICFVASWKQVIGLELVSYGKFSFSRPVLDGNKLANKCLARDLVVPRFFNFSFFEF